MKFVQRDNFWLCRSRFGANLSLAVLVVVWFIPTIMLLASSLRPVEEMLTTGWWSIFRHPGQLTLENYRLVLSSKGIGRGFINSLLIAVPSTVFPLILGAFAAFPLSFSRFPGRKGLFVSIIAMQIIPLQTVLIPVLLTLKRLGLSGTFYGVWLAHTGFGLPLCIYLYRNFFAQIPRSLVEAAKMDGANQWQIFWRLIVPVSKPVFASLAIFQFLWVWNDLLVALTVLGNPALSPLTVRIVALLGSLDAGWQIMTPAAFSSMVLPLALFIAFQKYFVRGILAGAVKG